jgi:hypothetical protein
VRADNAAGDAACLSCHQHKTSFEQTAHRQTSRLPTRDAILGSFSRGTNVLRTSNPNLYFEMDSTSKGFLETAVMGRPPHVSMESERIAFVTGSGRKGESYLYWRPGDHLFQLPISYWRGVGWANSPAYPDGRPNFDRQIPPRCLECHATAFQPVAEPQDVNRYRPTGIILGITCETCHGSGQDHVRREHSPLRAVLPRAIVNPARLSRDRQLDGCALCHNGAAARHTPAFSYVPGQPLEKRFDLWARADTAVDVHGNQLALLERSKCFLASQMTCATCHNVHGQQRDVVALSDRCLTCHAMQSLPRHGPELVGRCADCHMPALTSKTVVSNDPAHQVRVQVRTHWIKVYPQFQLP